MNQPSTARPLQGTQAPFRLGQGLGLAAVALSVLGSCQGIQLVSGPLLRVTQFEVGGEWRARLLIVMHHLVVDGVSWRILLDDLQAA